MKLRLWAYALVIYNPTLMAQVQELDIHLGDFCRDEVHRIQMAAEVNCASWKFTKTEESLKSINPLLYEKSEENEKKKICQVIGGLSNQNVKPVEFQLSDDNGDPWKIRFHFSFNRTNIRPTDIKIRSTLVDTDFQNWEFDERTSAKHYDPRNWKKLGDAFHWIDEPSNTFALSIENKKNAFYITAFHPKYLRTYYEEKTTNEQGITKVNYTPGKVYMSDGTPEAFASIPSGQGVVEIQNTHMQMNYQIGYGRKFTLMDKEKSGKINYIVRADVGVTTGESRSIYVKDWQWIENREKPSIQGFNGSIGHRLEYQKGKFGGFIEQKYTTSRLEHAFLDGTATYKLEHSNIAFGVNVDIFTLSKKEKDKKKTYGNKLE